MRPLPPLLVDLLICLRFGTRIPIPEVAVKAEQGLAGFSRAMRLLPLAGALVGAFGATALFAASSLGLSPVVAAPLAIAALVATSGGLHEDGLADCADGFGAAVSPARKLEIMADSRIGVFGALALALALYLRAASVAVVAGKSLVLGGAILVAAAAASRGAALIPFFLLPPARDSGAGFAARPQRASLATVAALSFAFAAIPLAAGAVPMRAALSLAACGAAGLAVSVAAKRQIGGQTGDVAGAAQQIAEVLFYLVYAAQI